MNRRGFLGLAAGLVVSGPRAPSLLHRLFAPAGNQVIPVAYAGETYLLTYAECIRRVAKRQLADWLANRLDEVAFEHLRREP